MKEGFCTLTALIPHGNTIAGLHELAMESGVFWGGLPVCIPLRIEADATFRDLWQDTISKHTQCIGFPVDVSFFSNLEPILEKTDSSDSRYLENLRAAVPSDRCLTFTSQLHSTDLFSAPLPCTMIVGIKKALSDSSENASSSGSRLQVDSESCRTFQIALLKMQITETGLITWQQSASCWAPKS